MISSETQIGGANRNYFNWARIVWAKYNDLKVKQAYLSREIRTVWANCNYFIWNKHSPRQLQQFQAKKCIVWSNGHYLSQLQLFQVKCAKSDPIVTISSKSGTVSVNDDYSNSNSGRTPPYKLEILEMYIWKFGGRYFIWWFWILINFYSKDYEFLGQKCRP